MFNEDSSLVKVDVKGWDTSSLEDPHWMFGECSNLTELDLPGWNTSKMTTSIANGKTKVVGGATYKVLSKKAVKSYKKAFAKGNSGKKVNVK